MPSTFDIYKLKSLLEDFFNLTQIRITVFDDQFCELAAYPEDLTEFCQLIRTDKNGAEKCKFCDKHACEIAKGRHSPYTYRCHAGMTESIIPLYLGNIVIGYLFFGQVFSYPTREAGWEEIQKLCQSYNLDQSNLKKACWQSPIITESFITSASHIMQAVASYLCIERMVSLRHKDLALQIDEYISSHFDEEINAQSLCDEFKIGKTQLYNIAKQNYGIGIAEHIRNLRIEKAKKLLQDSKLSLAEIATQCGFEDYNYFITVFKRIVGIPPKQYAKKDRMITPPHSILTNSSIPFPLTLAA